MKAQVSAKKPESGVVGRSHLPTFSRVSPDAVSDSPNADLEESASHPDGYNLANIPISAKPSGNNQRKTTYGLTSKLPIQAKLTIGEPNDKYEQEADRVAKQVVQQINTSKTVQPNQEPTIQREIMPDKDEEEKLQMKPLLQQKTVGEGETVSSELESSIQNVRGGGQLIPKSSREPIEQALGADFSRVKIHTDARSDQLNRSLQSNAFTTKQDILFRQGLYAPKSRIGQELIAHELVHVVQQNRHISSKWGRNQIKQNLTNLYQKNSIIQRHHTVKLTNTIPDKAIIYLVFEKKKPGPKGYNQNKKKDIVRYVGQTCETTGIKKRFNAHLASGLHKNWSHRTHWICAEFEGKLTRFETTCLEQLHIEAYWGSLENRQNSLTQKKFFQYSNSSTFRPKIRKLFPPNWCPHM